MAHARSSLARLVLVWLALLGLTALSFLLSLAHLGPADVALSLAIAVAKSGLVALFFMHLVEERFSVVMAPLLALFLLLVLIGLVVTDVATRRTFPRAPAPSVDELPAAAD
jgi:cytochrome c oxidase subunit 4